MAETLFPQRQRCKKCRGGFAPNLVVDGIFCSYKCAGVKAPTVKMDDAPRGCKRMVDNKWGFKQRYTHEEQVPLRLRQDPATNVYRCEYCRHLHVGHSRVIEAIPNETLKRAITDIETLGSVMLRRREALGIDKKILAKKMKVPAIRITEIERGDKKMDADVLVKLFWELHLSFELTEKPIRRGPR